MAVRTKLLSGRNINTDSDFSKYIETVSEPGVIEGFQVTSGAVAVGKAWVLCERTNGETIYSLVENFTEISLDTSGTGYVIISIPQNMIDDGSIINEDGTNVASVSVVNELPTKNYLELAELDSGVITDSRNMIKKVGELNTAIESLFSQVADLNERVEELEEAGAIDHLSDNGYVGELYTTSNNLFGQYTPTNSNSTLSDCHVGDTSTNTEIHIQRIASGVASNKLTLKIASVGSPTTNVKVEVRKGVQVTVSANSEAYWYGDESQILATGSLSYNQFSSSWAEKEFTLDSQINVDAGTLLDIVVYQESGGTKVVNGSNYYKLACDSTQRGEAFRFVSVNGSTRTKNNLMPYCVSSSFLGRLFSKIGSAYKIRVNETLSKTSGSNSGNTVTEDIFTASTTGSYNFTCNLTHSSQNASNAQFTLKIKNASDNIYYLSYMGSKTVNVDFTMNSGDILQVTYGGPSYTTGGFNTAVLKRARDILPKGSSAHKLKPTEQKGLGVKITPTSYGLLPDGSWWTGN